MAYVRMGNMIFSIWVGVFFSYTLLGCVQIAYFPRTWLGPLLLFPLLFFWSTHLFRSAEKPYASGAYGHVRYFWFITAASLIAAYVVYPLLMVRGILLDSGDYTTDSFCRIRHGFFLNMFWRQYLLCIMLPAALICLHRIHGRLSVFCSYSLEVLRHVLSQRRAIAITAAIAGLYAIPGIIERTAIGIASYEHGRLYYEVEPYYIDVFGQVYFDAEESIYTANPHIFSWLFAIERRDLIGRTRWPHSRSPIPRAPVWTGLDSATLRLYYEGSNGMRGVGVYAADTSTVQYMGRLLAADPGTFTMLFYQDDEFRDLQLAKDRLHVYNRGAILRSISPDGLRIIDDRTFANAYGTYQVEAFYGEITSVHLIRK